jgi:enoyl-CoA hydratase/carnithine racemase
MADELVHLERRDDGVAVITLDNPKVNALSSTLRRQLREAAEALTADPPGAVVVTGGERIFAAGADITEFGGADEAVGIGDSFHATMDAVAAIPRMVVAAVAGYALGGGCELAMACTLRLAADTAKLGQPEIALGLIPGYAGTQRLSRLVGKGKAMEMILTGAPIAAEEAQRIGLVNRVVPAAELMTQARALAAQLAKNAPIAMRYIINAVNKGVEMPFAEACQYEATLFGLVASTDDMKEGTAAFLAKRKPEFRGR